jgi:hypothetical protein
VAFRSAPLLSCNTAREGALLCELWHAWRAAAVTERRKFLQIDVAHPRVLGSCVCASILLNPCHRSSASASLRAVCRCTWWLA